MKDDRYIAFATNAPWMDVKEYSKRWTIETCYRLVENARAKSFGSNRPARLFCFLYSLTLFNAWALVNAQLASFLELRGGAYEVVVHDQQVQQRSGQRMPRSLPYPQYTTGREGPATYQSQYYRHRATPDGLKFTTRDGYVEVSRPD